MRKICTPEEIDEMNKREQEGRMERAKIDFRQGYGTRKQRANDAMMVYQSLTPDQKRRLD